MSNIEIKEQLRVYLRDHKDESFSPQQLQELLGLDLQSGYVYKILRVMVREKLAEKVFPENNKRAYFQYR